MATPEEEELNQLQSEKLKIEQQYQSILSKLTGKYKDVLDEQQSLAEQSKSLRVMQRSLTNALMAEMAQLRQYVNGEGKQRPLKARTIAGLQQELIRQERAYIESIKRLTGVVEDRFAAEQEAYAINAKIDAQRVAESKQKYLQILDRSTKQLERSLGIGPVFSTIGDTLRDMKDMDTKGQKFAVALAAIAGALNEFRETLEKTQKQIGTTLGTAFDQVIGAQVNAVKSIFIPGARVNAQEIIDATTAFTNEFGTILSPDAARGIAQEAKALGVSADIFVKARRQFLTVGEVTRIQSLYTSTFVNAGLRQAQAFEFAAQNANLVAIAGDKYAVSLAKAAANATKIGVSLDKTTNFFDNILDNFEGALETASELRALGIKIDFSDMARIAATGTPEEQQVALANLFRENRVALDNLQRQGFLRRSIETSFPQFDFDEIIRMAKGEPAIRPQEETVKEKSEQELQGVVAKSIDAMTALTGAILAIAGNYVLSSREVYRNTLATRANTVALSGISTGGGGVIPGGVGGAGGRARGVSPRVLGGVSAGGLIAGLTAPFVLASAQRDIEQAKQDESKKNAAILKSALGGGLEGFGYASIIPTLLAASGTVMSGGMLAAVLGGGALLGGLIRGFGASRQFDDFKVGPIGGRYLVTPDGVHPINPRDTIIGGTNLEAGLSGASSMQYGQTNRFPIGSLRAPLNDFVDPPVRPMTGRTGTPISVETAAIAALYGIDMRAQADQLPKTPQKPTLPRQNIPTIGPRTGTRVPEQTALQKTVDYGLTAAEFTPLIGDAMQAGRTARAFYDRDYGRGAMEAGFFGLGLLPFGELFRKGSRLGKRAAMNEAAQMITPGSRMPQSLYDDRYLLRMYHGLAPNVPKLAPEPGKPFGVFDVTKNRMAKQEGPGSYFATNPNIGAKYAHDYGEGSLYIVDANLKPGELINLEASIADDPKLLKLIQQLHFTKNPNDEFFDISYGSLWRHPELLELAGKTGRYDDFNRIYQSYADRINVKLPYSNVNGERFFDDNTARQWMEIFEQNADKFSLEEMAMLRANNPAYGIDYLGSKDRAFIQYLTEQGGYQGVTYSPDILGNFNAFNNPMSGYRNVVLFNPRTTTNIVGRERIGDLSEDLARNADRFATSNSGRGYDMFDYLEAKYPLTPRINKVKDIMMDPSANRYLTGPEGTFQLDSKDAVVAGTNLFDAGNVVEPRDADMMPMDITAPNVNTANLEDKLDGLYKVFSSMRIDLDANTVGRKSYDARSPMDRLSIVG